VPEDDSFDSREPNAGAFVVTAMQALKNGKQFIFVGHIKAGAVVFDVEGLFVANSDFAQFNMGEWLLVCIFPGITQQVLQNNPQQVRISYCFKTGSDRGFYKPLRLGLSERIDNFIGKLA